MINYFSLLIPICLIYMARYYILKHEHKELIYRYNNIVRMQKQQTMSENEEEQYE
jgi:hypothetical protein